MVPSKLRQRLLRRAGSQVTLGLEVMESRHLLTAGVIVTPSLGLVTSEAGGSAIVRVSLTQQPTAAVTIPLSSSNVGEGRVDVPHLVFTPATWNVVQEVRMTGQPDGIRDGNKSYQLITGNCISTDVAYSGLVVKDAKITNRDSSTLVAGITVTPTSGLKTSELGATTAFSIVLRYRPTSDVTVPLSSSNPAAGLPVPASVTFTPLTWDVPQVVAVTGRDDGLFNGDVPYKIVTGPAVATDPLYSGRNADDVRVLNIHRTDVSRYDGIYTGSFSGVVSGGGPVNGTVRAEIRGGTVTVTLPGSGGGTLSAGGGVDFSVSGGSVQGAAFVGALTTKAGATKVSGAGTWTYLDLSGVSARGRWTVLRTGV